MPNPAHICSVGRPQAIKWQATKSNEDLVACRFSAHIFVLGNKQRHTYPKRCLSSIQRPACFPSFDNYHCKAESDNDFVPLHRVIRSPWGSRRELTDHKRSGPIPNSSKLPTNAEMLNSLRQYQNGGTAPCKRLVVGMKIDSSCIARYDNYSTFRRLRRAIIGSFEALLGSLSRSTEADRRQGYEFEIS